MTGELAMSETTVRTIEYLDLYREMLAHQRTCDGLIPRPGSPEQPNQQCYGCLRSNPRDFVEKWPTQEKRPQRRFSWAIPTETALAHIATHSPNGVVEIGAGGGYWAMLLRQRGVDVVAYDPASPGADPDRDPWFIGAHWSEVLPGDHTKVVEHPDRTLLLCWPPYDAPWTHEAVERFRGDTVVYIGEGSNGCTGTDQMHSLLGLGGGCWHYGDDECDCVQVTPLFEQVAEVDIPQWSGLHDRLTVHRRIGATS